MDPQIQQTTPLPQAPQPASQGSSTGTHISPLIILILLFVFPPLAWYFMWKESRYHKWFPILLILYSTVSLILLSVFIFFVYPQITALYKSFAIEQPNSWIQYFSYVLMAIAVSQVIFSIILFRKLKSNPTLPKNFLVLTVIFLALYYLAAPVFSVIAQLSVITPIYTLTDSFNDYSLSPTPPANTNINLKTYNADGYQLTVPSYYMITEDTQNNWVTFSHVIKAGEKERSIVITSQKATEDDPCTINQIGYPNTTCTTINGYPALDWGTEIPPLPMGPLEFRYTFIHNGIQYQIQFLDIEKTEKDQILSTFKFLDQNGSTGFYQHPYMKYSFSYPSEWVIATKSDERGEYANFVLQSPDYESTDGFQLPKTGAEISVSSGKSPEPFESIDDYTPQDSFISQVAKDKKIIFIDRIRAIQYDFDYEGIGTNTHFLQDGYIYTIRYEYPKKSDKDKYLNIYQMILDTFKF